MFPVSSSEPATRTSTRPSENARPLTSVIIPPHTSGSIPAETVIASRAPKAMYAPPRKPATSSLSHDVRAFLAPVSIPALAISGGDLKGMGGAPQCRVTVTGCAGSGSAAVASPRAFRATATSSSAESGPAPTQA